MSSPTDSSYLSRREFRASMAALFAALMESDDVILRGLHRARASRKSDGSEVTRADKDAERILRACLATAWPDDVIQGEEYGGTLSDRGRCWLVDPIDGTASYVLGIPMFGTLIALLIDGEPVLGCIHLPALGETTYASTGHGCWLQRRGAKARRVRVGTHRPLSRAKVGMTSVKENSWHAKPGGPEVARLARAVGRLRMAGDCVQYALLCRGALDAAVDPFMKPWDIAALVPCVTEAGGVISDLQGASSRLLERTSIVAASSARLRDEIVRATREPNAVSS
jgi:histidinol-phosphatase